MSRDGVEARGEEGAAAYLDAILRAAVDAIVVIDEEGTIELFSAAAETMFGHTAEEMIGQPVDVLMPEPFRGEHRGYIDRFLRTGEARIIGRGREVEALRKDGTLFPVEIAIGEIAATGRRRFVGLMKDVTARKETEARLIRTEEELRRTFENAPVGIAVLDLEGRFLRVNTAMTGLLMHSREELNGTALVELVEEEDRPACSDLLQKTVAEAAPTRGLRLRFLRSDGEIRRGVIRCGVVHDEHGAARLLIAQMEDLTERIRAREQAREVTENLAHVGRVSLLGEMTAGIAHEINQPLTAIATYASACSRLMDAGDQEKAETALEHIKREALRAGEVVRRLRGIAKKGDKRHVSTDVNALVKDVVSLARVDESMPEVRLELLEGLPEVVADPVQIQQVVLNLLRNAAEAMDGDRTAETILVSTFLTQNGDVEVAVVDRGSGIPKTAAEGVFHPFFTTKPEGMGLGLSICTSIIQSHGGRLWFTDNPRGGTIFRFILPMYREPSEETA